MKCVRQLRSSLFALILVLCTIFVPTQHAYALDTPLSQAGSFDIPNLSNASDYRSLNLFLSNFSESNLCGYGSRTFSATHSSSRQRAELAFNNYAQNGGNVEWVDYGVYNVRASVADLNNTLEHLIGFGMKGGWSDLSNPSDWFYYENGYLYTQVTNGFLLCGPTVATKVSRYKPNIIKVKFHAYYQTAGETRYQIGSKSQYSMTESELNRFLGVRGPNKRGTALVRVSGSSGNWHFTLERWTVKDY